MGKKTLQEKNTQQKGYKSTALLAASFVAVAALAFAAGWWADTVQDASNPLSKSLRLGRDEGYHFIDPLLLCNINGAPAAQEDDALAKQLQSIINKHVAAGELSKASVYYANINSGTWADVNPDEKYYPSSLGKIPIMMAYYQYAESHPGALDKKILYPKGGEDRNDMQDIQPEKAIVPGSTYTVRELLDYMIKYSDNNATDLLYANIDRDMLNRVYADLNIPVNEDPTADTLDFITAHQISTLFRVLYNATYLSRADSEAALDLLSQSSFVQGIVAGVGDSTTVSHKLGLVGIAQGDVTAEHELHDCGIVYSSKDTYHLCVMTRGSAPLASLESIIAELSKTVYDKVGN